MNLNIGAYTTSCNSKTSFKEILSHLTKAGYEPLISKAKQYVSEIFGGIQLETADPENMSSESYFDYNLRKRAIKFGTDNRIPFTGDLLFSKKGHGIFYIIFAIDLNSFRTSSKEGNPNPDYELEIGLIGDNQSKPELKEIIESISNYFISIGHKQEWEPVQPRNAQFSELRYNQENKVILANTISEKDLKLAEILEDETTRNIALAIRRSGGILSADLMKKSTEKPDDLKKGLSKLLDTKLVSQEFVVICNKTSNQINRVDSKEKIKQMTEIGVLCSCGNPIAKERIEELLSASVGLQKMLDQSYWMTAWLVSLFKNAGIPDENILLNLHEGPEEIDAFIDVEGNLLMFELKDNEFSMGHAYPFSGRIGLYKPDYAVIVATKGISPDVREYFKRVKPGTEIVYVGNLKELEDNLHKIINQTRSIRASELLSQIEPMANVSIPLAQIMFEKLDINKALLSKRRDGLIRA